MWSKLVIGVNIKSITKKGDSVVKKALITVTGQDGSYLAELLKKGISRYKTSFIII